MNTAELQLVSISERPDLRPAMESLEAATYPDFFIEGQDNYYEQVQRLGDAPAAYDLAFVEAGGDRVLAGAGAAPIAWDGTDVDLPAGYDDGLQRCVDAAEGRAKPNALNALNLMVSEEARGLRLSVRLMEALAERAANLGPVFAAIRCALKHEHPRVPMSEYVQWTRDDGKPFDPWIRSFLEAGARIGPTSPESLTITGSIAEWSKWTGMEFPDGGEHEIPGGLAPLRVDLESGRGAYVEPSAWVILDQKGTR